MTMPIFVSIVTPVFNQESFIAQAIESVLAQDYPHIEYIVIDDGSTDGTPDVIARYAGKVITMRHPNMGQVRSLNKGWAGCRGQILGYLSADDVLLPSAVSHAVTLLEAEPDTVMVYSDWILLIHSLGSSDIPWQRRRTMKNWWLNKSAISVLVHFSGARPMSRSGAGMSSCVWHRTGNFG